MYFDILRIFLVKIDICSDIITEFLAFVRCIGQHLKNRLSLPGNLVVG